MPTTHRELDEPAPVLLRDGGLEIPAWLLAWGRDRDGWRAYVEWSTGDRRPQSAHRSSASAPG